MSITILVEAGWINLLRKSGFMISSRSTITNTSANSQGHGLIGVLDFCVIAIPIQRDAPTNPGGDLPDADFLHLEFQSCQQSRGTPGFRAAAVKDDVQES
jgi:hypothetical protein